jgi:hypothetical protein
MLSGLNNKLLDNDKEEVFELRAKSRAQEAERKYFYDNEYLIMRTRIPLFRLLSTSLLIYGIYCGIDFIADLCTDGMQIIFSFSLLCSSLNFGWALWYDASYSVPPTWTFLKEQGYYTITIIAVLMYQASLVGISAFCVITGLIFTFADLKEIFQWECNIL